MTGKIVYGREGVKYFVNGHEVSEAGYNLVFPSKLDEMFATGQAPVVVTDSTFMRGHCNGSQFEKHPHIGDAYKAVADAAGVDTTGKVYKSGLADYPGDPKAWVSGRGDVQRVCEERGWNCDGAVKVKGAPPSGGVQTALADDIVEREVNEVVAKTPGRVTPRERRDLKEKVRSLRKPHYAKGG